MESEMLELTLSSNYVPSWGVLEGVRELVQNGLDAKVDGFEFSIKFDSVSKVLVLENKGARLEKSTLLFGKTTKDGRDDQIGRFGEGFKIGFMALVRKGLNVLVKNGEELWRPMLVESSIFSKEKVLGIRIEQAEEVFDGIQIIVNGFTSVDFYSLSTILLPKGFDKFLCSSGLEILVSKSVAGRFYVGGILVEVKEGFECGYNFKPGMVKTDRDRKMIDFQEAALVIQDGIIEYGMNGGLSRVLEILRAEKQDLGCKFKYFFWADSGFSKLVAQDFVEKYGENAYPVIEDRDVDKILFMGKRPVVVSRSYGIVVRDVLGSLDGLYSMDCRDTKKRYSEHELTFSERRNYDLVKTVLRNVGYNEYAIQIVEFKAESMRGLFSDVEILVARKELADKITALRVIVHELAHKVGLDGSREHEEMQAQIWSNIVRFMWDEVLAGRGELGFEDGLVEFSV